MCKPSNALSIPTPKDGRRVGNCLPESPGHVLAQVFHVYLRPVSLQSLVCDVILNLSDCYS
jgi:hypothetical protein